MAEKELYQMEATLKSHSTRKSSVTAMLCMSFSNLPTTPKVWALDAPCFVMKFSILKRTKENIYIYIFFMHLQYFLEVEVLAVACLDHYLL